MPVQYPVVGELSFVEETVELKLVMLRKLLIVKFLPVLFSLGTSCGTQIIPVLSADFVSFTLLTEGNVSPKLRNLF